MQDLIIENSILVENNMPTVSTGQSYYFPDIPELRNGVYIYAIEAFSVAQVSKSPAGNTIVAAAAVVDIVLTLVVGQDEKVFQIPYYTLISSLNGGLIRRFNNMPVNIVKSYIRLVSNTVTATNSAIFNFIYSKNPRCKH